MRRLILGALLILAAGPAFAAESEAALLERAQLAFAEGRYGEAADVYGALLDGAPADIDLMFNQGTAWAHQGELGLALWRYHQALRHDPRDRALHHNLKVIDPDYRQKLALSPLPPLDRLYYFLTGDEWLTLASAAALAAMAAGTLALLSARDGRARARLRTLALGCVLASLMTLPFAATHYVQDFPGRRAIITHEKAVVRAGPSENSLQTWSPALGTIVRIRDKHSSDWLLIDIGNQGTGYISANQLRRL